MDDCPRYVIFFNFKCVVLFSKVRLSDAFTLIPKWKIMSQFDKLTVVQNTNITISKKPAKNDYFEVSLMYFYPLIS